MIPRQLTTNLNRSLQAIGQLLSALPASDWQRPQGTKWTIAQEVEHMHLATQGTAFVLSEAARPRWHPSADESRSFGTIVEQYQTALSANPTVTNAATRPAEASAQLTLQQQTENWQHVLQSVLAAVATLSAADLDAYTVWKHPLLGPLTVREMIYFTIHHTDHHYGSLKNKAGV